MKYDITDCFHSIGWPAVKPVFLGLGYPEAVSFVLTALCTHRVNLLVHQTLSLFDGAQRERLKQRHLPQGTPSSPALANAVLYRLDVRLSGLAKSLDMDYSRYADDMDLKARTAMRIRTFAHTFLVGYSM